MISHEFKCIFIHIPKTAGTSIEKKLGLFPEHGSKRGLQDHRTIAEIEPLTIKQTLSRACPGNAEWLWPNIKNRIRCGNEIAPKQFNAYYKFTVVRNPWGRAFSWYRNVMRDPHHKKTLQLPSNCTFKEFVTRHLTGPIMRPQTSWLKDTSGNLAMDFIGRFENLENDFSVICQRLGFDNSDLPKVMMGDGSDYTKYYDEQSAEIIAKRYAEEIALFSYRFDG